MACSALAISDISPYVFDELGGAISGVGPVPLTQLGVLPNEVTGVAAKATAGADGFSSTNASLNGFQLQLYAVSDVGSLFQTCGSAPSSASSPGTVACAALPFSARSSVGLRVKPSGFSNMRPVRGNVTEASIDVLYR